MAPKPDRDLDDWLYRVMIVALAIYFVVGGVAWVVLLFQGRGVPDSFATILAAIAGGLVGTLGSRVGPGGGG